MSRPVKKGFTMFTEKWRWPLVGKDQRITIRVIGKTGSLAKNAIFDTGSTHCAFSEDDFSVLFAGESKAGAAQVRGVGVAREISRRVTIELYSQSGELIEKITNVSASFILDSSIHDEKTGEKKIVPFDEAIIGISNVIDRFRWVLDYPGAKMTAEKP
jgi:hypothetical protein